MRARKKILARVRKIGKNLVQPTEVNNVESPLPAEESAENVESKKVEFAEGELCPVCEGSGLDKSDIKRETLCSNCEGSGGKQ